MDNAKEVNIRVQQRNGRKCITTVSNLNQFINFDTLVKHFKTEWGCAGTVIPTPNGKVLQLQGDQLEKLKEFLVTEKLVLRENIRDFKA